MNIKRYDKEMVGRPYLEHEEMVPNDEGDWVLYDEHKSILAVAITDRDKWKSEAKQLLEYVLRLEKAHKSIRGLLEKEMFFGVALDNLTRYKVVRRIQEEAGIKECDKERERE